MPTACSLFRKPFYYIVIDNACLNLHGGQLVFQNISGSLVLVDEFLCKYLDVCI